MRGLSRTFLGLITLAMMGLGGWYILNLVNAGFTNKEDVRLILRFSDAHGVPTGGDVRHKGVRVGEILKVDIAPDDSGVIMEAVVEGRFHHTLRKNSRFWIVRPYFGGLTQGASGLDTLIKDPYVEYDSPDLGAHTLASGSIVYGLNLPPVVENSAFYPKNERLRAKLGFKVRFNHAQGLREGAPVLYRDVPVGTVLKIDLSLDGRSVETEVLIHSRYRETVRSDSLFWVARPSVEFGFYWPTLMNIQDLSKIFTGAMLAYATPTESRGEPLKNGDVVEGLDNPPGDLAEYQGPLVSVEPENGQLWPEGFTPDFDLVRVSFAFSEKDLLQNQTYLYQGTGLFFEGRDGKPMVLTARTLADGVFSSSDWLSDPDIEKADLKVLLPDQSVHEAERVWIDPEGRDVALLSLSDDSMKKPLSHPRFSPGEPQGEYYLLIAFREDHPKKIRCQPIPSDKLLDNGAALRRFHPNLNLSLEEWWGALLVDQKGSIIGITGREEAHSEHAAIAVIEKVPSVETQP